MSLKKFEECDLSVVGKKIFEHYVEYHKSESRFASECIIKSLKEYSSDKEMIMSVEELKEDDFLNYLSSITEMTSPSWKAEVGETINNIIKEIGKLPEGTSAFIDYSNERIGIKIRKIFQIPLSGEGILTSAAERMGKECGVPLYWFMEIFANYYVRKKLSDILFPDDYGKLFPGCLCNIKEFVQCEDKLQTDIDYFIPVNQITKERILEVFKEIGDVPAVEDLL